VSLEFSKKKGNANNFAQDEKAYSGFCFFSQEEDSLSIGLEISSNAF